MKHHGIIYQKNQEKKETQEGGEGRTKGPRERIHSVLLGKVKVKDSYPSYL